MRVSSLRTGLSSHPSSTASSRVAVSGGFMTCLETFTPHRNPNAWGFDVTKDSMPGGRHVRIGKRKGRTSSHVGRYRKYGSLIMLGSWQRSFCIYCRWPPVFKSNFQKLLRQGQTRALRGMAFEAWKLRNKVCQGLWAMPEVCLVGPKSNKGDLITAYLCR